MRANLCRLSSKKNAVDVNVSIIKSQSEIDTASNYFDQSALPWPLGSITKKHIIYAITSFVLLFSHSMEVLFIINPFNFFIFWVPPGDDNINGKATETVLGNIRARALLIFG